MRKLWALPALALLAVLLSGCAERTYSYKAVVEWSRGHKVGTTGVTEPVALGVAPDGQRVVLVWTAGASSDAAALHLLVVEGQGSILIDRDLPVPVSQPEAPRLALARDESLHLAWIDNNGDTRSLFYARLDVQGQLLDQPQVLSPADMRVFGYQMAVLPAGDALVVWSTRLGLQAARIAPDGAARYSEMLESPGAAGLDFKVDDAGLAYVAWQQSLGTSERRLSHTTLETDTLAFSWPMYLGTEMLRTGPSLSGSAQRVEGPAVSLDLERVIISWTVSESRGSRGEAYYASLVPGELKEVTPSRIAISPSYPPAYQAASGILPYRQLAPTLPPTAVAYRADMRSAPASIAGQGQEVPLALSVAFRTAWSVEFQPALVVLQGGKAVGYQAVAMTRFPSLYPSLAADGDGDLYMSWIDVGGREGAVYLATTAPALRATWDRIGSGDLAVALEQLGGRMVSALGVVLLGISWIILPGFFLVVTLFIFREDSLAEVKGQIMLFVLIGVHWAGKFLFTMDFLAALPRLRDLPLIFPLSTLLAPGALAYLPNQAGLPGGLAPLLPYLVPSLTLLAGATITRLTYLKLSKEPHAVPAYVILAVVDVFLAIQIYALTYFDPMRY